MINNLKLNKVLKNLSILYIEDEEEIRENIKKTLLLLCGKVHTTSCIKDSREILSNHKIDIIISDINLPDQNGLSFAKEIREIDKIIPIILLTAHTDKEFLLQAARLKLIDYLTKPIDFKTLNIALQKSAQDILYNSRYIINFENNIQYNVQYRELFNLKTQKEISLTAKEIKLLDYLIKNSNRVISHEELKANIWEDDFQGTDSALKNILNKLRKKIGKDNILNISGVGFRLNILKNES